MMAKVGTEALTQRERISSLTSVIRDHRLATGSLSRRDRLLGVDGSTSSLPPPSAGLNEAGEFKEEDVWAAGEMNNSNPASGKSPPSDEKLGAHRNAGFGYVEVNNPGYIPGGRRWLGDTGRGLSSLSRNSQHGGIGRVTSASRMIPQMVSSGTGGNGESGRKTVVVAQSAPVNVPDWSRMMGNKSKSKSKNDRFRHGGEEDEGDEDGGDQDGFSVHELPPHELVARSQTTTFSVFEGAGRTLKGRDLSRVRNAVLKQTGFL